MKSGTVLGAALALTIGVAFAAHTQDGSIGDRVIDRDSSDAMYTTEGRVAVPLEALSDDALGTGVTAGTAAGGTVSLDSTVGEAPRVDYWRIDELSDAPAAGARDLNGGRESVQRPPRRRPHFFTAAEA